MIRKWRRPRSAELDGRELGEKKREKMFESMLPICCVSCLHVARVLAALRPMAAGGVGERVRREDHWSRVVYRRAVMLWGPCLFARGSLGPCPVRSRFIFIHSFAHARARAARESAGPGDAVAVRRRSSGDHLH